MSSASSYESRSSRGRDNKRSQENDNRSLSSRSSSSIDKIKQGDVRSSTPLTDDFESDSDGA